MDCCCCCCCAELHSAITACAKMRNRFKAPAVALALPTSEMRFEKAVTPEGSSLFIDVEVDADDCDDVGGFDDDEWPHDLVYVWVRSCSACVTCSARAARLDVRPQCWTVDCAARSKTLDERRDCSAPRRCSRAAVPATRDPARECGRGP